MCCPSLEGLSTPSGSHAMSTYISSARHCAETEPRHRDAAPGCRVPRAARHAAASALSALPAATRNRALPIPRPRAVASSATSTTRISSARESSTTRPTATPSASMIAVLGVAETRGGNSASCARRCRSSSSPTSPAPRPAARELVAPRVREDRAQQRVVLRLRPAQPDARLRDSRLAPRALVARRVDALQRDDEAHAQVGRHVVVRLASRPRCRWRSPPSRRRRVARVGRRLHAGVLRPHLADRRVGVALGARACAACVCAGIWLASRSRSRRPLSRRWSGRQPGPLPPMQSARAPAGPAVRTSCGRRRRTLVPSSENSAVFCAMDRSLAIAERPAARREIAAEHADFGNERFGHGSYPPAW